MAPSDAAREPPADAAEASAQRLADRLAQLGGPVRLRVSEGCVNWVPWTGRSTPRWPPRPPRPSTSRCAGSPTPPITPGSGWPSPPGSPSRGAERRAAAAGNTGHRRDLRAGEPRGQDLVVPAAAGGRRGRCPDRHQHRAGRGRPGGPAGPGCLPGQVPTRRHKD